MTTPTPGDFRTDPDGTRWRYVRYADGWAWLPVFKTNNLELDHPENGAEDPTAAIHHERNYEPSWPAYGPEVDYHQPPVYRCPRRCQACGDTFYLADGGGIVRARDAYAQHATECRPDQDAKGVQ